MMKRDEFWELDLRLESALGRGYGTAATASLSFFPLSFLGRPQLCLDTLDAQVPVNVQIEISI